jgi:hypothetical protein
MEARAWLQRESRLEHGHLVEPTAAAVSLVLIRPAALRPVVAPLFIATVPSPKSPVEVPTAEAPSHWLLNSVDERERLQEWRRG